MSGTLLVTYCAADKDPDPAPLPAARRYRSTRIAAVAELAARQGAGFRILSGRFGLLAPETPVPWYDHLLCEAEVAGLARGVAARLREEAPDSVVFVTRTPAEDPQAAPYRACCEGACELAGIVCEVLETPRGDLTADDLEDQ